MNLLPSIAVPIKFILQQLLVKPIYNRVMRIPAVTVSGTIELNGEDISGCQLLFMNKRTNTATQAKLNGNSYSVSLAAGEEYTAVLSGVTGIGFTNDTKGCNDRYIRGIDR